MGNSRHNNLSCLENSNQDLSSANLHSPFAILYKWPHKRNRKPTQRRQSCCCHLTGQGLQGKNSGFASSARHAECQRACQPTGRVGACYIPNNFDSSLNFYRIKYHFFWISKHRLRLSFQENPEGKRERILCGTSFKKKCSRLPPKKLEKHAKCQ